MLIMELSINKKRKKYDFTSTEDALSTYYGYLITTNNKIPYQVDGDTASSYRGDFYGLLRSLGIPHDVWGILLHLNGLYSSTDYDGNTDLYLLDGDNLLPTIQRLRGK
jgi:uncharacterized protein YbgA (DUF1722 family)